MGYYKSQDSLNFNQYIVLQICNRLATAEQAYQKNCNRKTIAVLFASFLASRGYINVH